MRQDKNICRTNHTAFFGSVWSIMAYMSSIGEILDHCVIDLCRNYGWLDSKALGVLKINFIQRERYLQRRGDSDIYKLMQMLTS